MNLAFLFSLPLCILSGTIRLRLFNESIDYVGLKSNMTLFVFHWSNLIFYFYDYFIVLFLIKKIFFSISFKFFCWGFNHDFCLFNACPGD